MNKRIRIRAKKRQKQNKNRFSMTSRHLPTRKIMHKLIFFTQVTTEKIILARETLPRQSLKKEVEP